MDVLGRITELREALGWSNYRLAKKANLSENAINTMFRRNHQPTIHTLEAICKGLGVSLSQFFAEGDGAIYLSEEQHEMLRTWNTLTQAQKDALMVLLKSM